MFGLLMARKVVERLRLFVELVVLRIPRDANHGAGLRNLALAAAQPHRFAHCIFRRPKFARHRLIDDHVRDTGSRFLRRKTAASLIIMAWQFPKDWIQTGSRSKGWVTCWVEAEPRVCRTRW